LENDDLLDSGGNPQYMCNILGGKFMIVLNILSVIIQVFACLYLIVDIIYSIRSKKLQKEWDEERAMRVRMNPAISRAELCEQYVMFCKRNGGKVEFKDE
jgi:hypothetical protein